MASSPDGDKEANFGTRFGCSDHTSTTTSRNHRLQFGHTGLREFRGLSASPRRRSRLSFNESDNVNPPRFLSQPIDSAPRTRNEQDLDGRSPDYDQRRALDTEEDHSQPHGTHQSNVRDRNTTSRQSDGSCNDSPLANDGENDERFGGDGETLLER